MSDHWLVVWAVIGMVSVFFGWSAFMFMMGVVFSKEEMCGICAAARRKEDAGGVE